MQTSATNKMSLWQKVASAPDIERQMKSYYDEKGQAEIRVLFAQWIEERIMSEKVATSSPDIYQMTAVRFYEDLQQKVLTMANESDNIVKFQLVEICNKMGQITAVDFYSHLRNGLQKELEYFETIPRNNYIPSMERVDELFTILNRIQDLTRSVDYFKGSTTTFRSECESFQIFFNDFTQNEHAMNAQHMNAVLLAENKHKLEDQYRVLLARKSVMLVDLKKIVSEYDTIQSLVIDTELKNWQRNQALAGNGEPFKDNLDDIQRCIEELVETVCKIVACINSVILINSGGINIGDNTELTELLDRVRLSQEVLVLSAFIVEKQPPQVMKTNTRFSAAVRWLIGPQLGIYMNNPTVECIILSEAQAQRHSAQRVMNDATPHSSGEILNNFGTMEYQQPTRVFSASFRNMQLKKIKRAEKKGTESVMDEKFALLFYASSIVNDYRIRVWTLSLPVVVIVHGNQEPQSWATITWDNAFSDIVREPFQVPDKVSWSQLSLALNTKFCSATGRALTDENMHFLYEKLFRNDVMGDHKDYISWAQFCKEPLPDRAFTFWDWFFAIMKLTKDHLLGLWKAGLVIGFINKRRTTDEILRNTPAGTFLLRFSDSELGGITVAFVNDDGNVLMLAPWTARDLHIRGLADRVQDLTPLRYVYPRNIAKEEAFGEFYTQRIEQTSRDGYVPNMIRAHVPGIESTQPNTTPLHMQSPNPQELQMTNENMFPVDFESMLY